MDFIQELNNLGWLANLAEFIGFFVLALTLINTYLLRTELKEGSKRITLVLQVDETKSYTLPGFIWRKDFSRQEIMGRLGMIRLKGKDRFSLGYVQNPKFLDEIEKIYQEKDDAIMTIPCSQAEFEQFDFIPR